MESATACRPSQHDDPGFTLVELLVVVSIIALLMSVLMPSLRQARDTAIRIKCASQLHQISLADYSYANSNAGYRPYRDGGLPHQVQVPYHFNLNTTFITPYLVNRNIMFCPSRLLEVRNAGTSYPDYAVEFVTYQDHNMVGGTWLGSVHPTLSHINTTAQRVAIWSCATIATGPGATAPWFGHDDPITGDPPPGMNSAFTDGSVNWTNFARTERFWSSGSQWYYWPKP